MEKFNLNPPMSGLVTELMTKKAKPEVYNEWKRAFDRFNSDNNLHKGMGCRKCYSEVYEYIRKQGLLDTIKIYEFPEDYPNNTYVIGIDPYEDKLNKTSNLGEISIYRKTKKLTLWEKLKKIWS